jgi:hypothetical protein
MEAGMDEEGLKDVRRQIMQATLELETKAVNYLLVANGAGFAGCLASLKDYRTVPELHEIGALIVLFAAGLVLGTLAFVSFQSAHFEIMQRVLVGEDSPRRATIFMSISNFLMKASGGAFILAILIIADRLAKL